MTDDAPFHVYIALGSNLGDRMATVRQAMQRMAAWSRRPIRRSGLWRTVPIDCPPGAPDFVNAIVALTPRSGDTPESWLRLTQSLERLLGRRPKAVANEPRPLDLDLIAWGDLVVNTEDLVLPHPRAHQRAFVLCPLAELAPSLTLPGQTQTVGELARRAPDIASVHRLADA